MASFLALWSSSTIIFIVIIYQQYFHWLGTSIDSMSKLCQRQLTYLHNTSIVAVVTTFTIIAMLITTNKAWLDFEDSSDEINVMSEIIYYCWLDLMMFTLMILRLVCWLFFNISYVCHQYFPSNVQTLVSMPCRKL